MDEFPKIDAAKRNGTRHPDPPPEEETEPPARPRHKAPAAYSSSEWRISIPRHRATIS